MVRIIHYDGPIKATFEFDTKDGSRKLHTTLESLDLGSKSRYEEYTVDELLEAHLVCFSEKLEMVIKETKIVPDENGKYGRLVSND